MERFLLRKIFVSCHRLYRKFVNGKNRNLFDLRQGILEFEWKWQNDVFPPMAVGKNSFRKKHFYVLLNNISLWENIN